MIFTLTAMMAVATMNAHANATADVNHETTNDSIATDTTQWFNKTQELGEVVVNSTLPKTRAKGDAMRTTVTGSILEKAGSASDALKRIPSLETEQDGPVK